MRPHEWISAPALLKARVEKASNVAIMIAEDPSERRYWMCLRCGSSMTTAAFGKMPSFFDVPAMPGKGVVLTMESPKREITGWETIGEGELRCGVSPDCDEALASRLMES